MIDIIWGRFSLLVYSGMATAISAVASFYFPVFIFILLISFFLFTIALKDFLQKKRSILSNFPNILEGKI